MGLWLACGGLKGAGHTADEAAVMETLHMSLKKEMLEWWFCGAHGTTFWWGRPFDARRLRPPGEEKTSIPSVRSFI